MSPQPPVVLEARLVCLLALAVGMEVNDKDSEAIRGILNAQLASGAESAKLVGDSEPATHFQAEWR